MLKFLLKTAAVTAGVGLVLGLIKRDEDRKMEEEAKKAQDIQDETKEEQETPVKSVPSDKNEEPETGKAE